MDRLYNGLTKDTHMGALATAQSMHLKAIADDSHAIDSWEAEVNRIQMILDNWDTLAKESE